MKTVKLEVLRYMMKGLKPYTTLCVADIPRWQTKAGRYLGGGLYEYDESSRQTLCLGDTWEASYDCAQLFAAEVTVPPSPVGKTVFLELDFGGEALVKINGRIVGAVSSDMNGGWVCRDRVFLDALQAGDTLAIELEASVNAGGFCDAAMDGATHTVYTLNKARLVATDPVCEGYEFDLQTAFAALEVIEDEYIKARVYEAIDKSLHIVDFDFDDARVRRSIQKAGESLREDLAAVAHLPACKVIMTGHSHIDIAWLWRVQESERKAARTFANNLALMDRYEDFTFAQSQAILYDMTKRLYPELYERIREKVRKGQWDIVGNVWVEADTNIASGEALIRQLLYGRDFFKREFGVVSDTYWLPDCFGFSWALPQIIRRSGMKHFITAKLTGQDTNRFPHTIFRWRGNDSSEVLAYVQRVAYGGECMPQDLRRAEKENDQKDIVPTVLGMFGYGDGGGGCTYAMMERGRRLARFPGLPACEIGHVEDFFINASASAEDLPVYNDELYYENHRGTYTSQAFVKRHNRKGEILLTRAEATAVFASVFADATADTGSLDEAWKLLLKNQFHDILPGTSIHQAHQDCHTDYGRMHVLGESVKFGALAALNARVKVDADGILVWNLLPHTVTAPVFVDVPGGAGGLSVFYDETPLPCARVEVDGRELLAFLAPDLPPMGLRAFSVGYRAEPLPTVIAEKTRLENERLRVTLDADGILTSLYDKLADREVLAGEGNLLTVFQDKCVHETAWNLELNYQKKFWELREAQSIEVLEANELRGVVRVVRVFNNSRITQDIILYTGADRLDFVTAVDWYESDKLLKAAFTVDILSTRASFEIAHGAISRPTHWNNGFDRARFEQSAHKWADLSEGGYGVSLLNDCKYGYDIKDNVMRLSLLRAPTCPDRTGDHGINTFTYSVYPHENDWRDAQTVRRGLELNCPPEAFFCREQHGALPPDLSFIGVNAKNAVIDAVKPALDGDSIIVRVVEVEQRRGEVRLTTLLPCVSVWECNLMEENETPVPADENGFSFYLKPFEVKSFRLKPGNKQTQELTVKGGALCPQD